VARAQEITIWGRRGISWLPIQSNPFRLRDSARDISHPAARKVARLAPKTRCDESTSRVSILGLLEGGLEGRLLRRGYEKGAPIASLCHHHIFGCVCICEP
jgi:hypothetical protein